MYTTVSLTNVRYKLIGRIIFSLLCFDNIAVGNVDVETSEILHGLLAVIHGEVIVKQLILSCCLGLVKSLLEQLNPEHIEKCCVTFIAEIRSTGHMLPGTLQLRL